MPVSRNRDIATILGRSEALNADNTGLGGGLTVYATLDDLPTTGLTSGDQAYVSSSSRFYISNGSGWYNVALVNATPNLTIDPTGTIVLAQDGSTTSVLTLTGTDSDYPDANLTYSVESDGSFFGLGTISQDSSVFTITPLSQDSATTSSATLTFKASDGISFGSASRSFSLSFTTTNSHKTMSLIKADTSFNDNQIDASTNSHTITELGNVTSTAFSPHHPGGYSVYFDGTDDHLISGTGVTSIAAGDFTVEFWWYPATTVTQQQTLAHFNAGGPGGTNIWCNTSAQLVVDNGTVGTTAFSNTTFTLRQWNHVAITRSGTTTTGYINGVLAGSHSYSPIASDRVQIGRYQATYHTVGYITDFRYVAGTVVYTSAFTPPTERLTAIANTALLACHLPYIADGSSNDHTITANGNTSTKRFGPYDYLPYTRADHGGSVYFDGTGDWLTIANGSEQMVPEAGDFTVEFWFYTSNASTRQDPWSSYTSSTGWAVAFSLTTAGDITPYYGNSTPHQTAGGQFEANVWNHFAMARSGTSLKIFMNGKTIYTDASDTRDYSGTSTLYIGAAGNATYPFNGYISDARFVKGTAVYTADFTPPTQPLTAITNTELLTCTNRHDIVDVAGGSKITKTGQITTSDAARKWSTISSTYHQGSNDWYSFTLPAPLGDDFTVEMWVNHTSWSDNVGIWDFSGAYGLGAFGSRLKWWDNGQSPQYNIHENSEMDALAGTWWHFALCRTGGNSYKAFINGSLEGSWTLSGGISQTIRIGNDQYGKDLLGYVQDVRVTNGLARYTAAFTPPTAEFDG